MNFSKPILSHHKSLEALKPFDYVGGVFIPKTFKTMLQFTKPFEVFLIFLKRLRSFGPHLKVQNSPKLRNFLEIFGTLLNYIESSEIFFYKALRRIFWFTRNVSGIYLNFQEHPRASKYSFFRNLVKFKQFPQNVRNFSEAVCSRSFPIVLW